MSEPTEQEKEATKQRMHEALDVLENYVVGGKLDGTKLTHDLVTCKQELAEAKAKLLSININDLPEKDREYEQLEKERDQLQNEVHELREEDKNSCTLISKQAGILQGVSIALKGQPPPLTQFSHHDLTELAQAVVQERDQFRVDYCAAKAGIFQLKEELAECMRKGKQATDIGQRFREERDQLRKTITDFLEGNYDHPRTHRPKDCQHGRHYWEDCNDCDIAFFEGALEQPDE